MIKAALDEETADHLGYDKHATEDQNPGNSRNGKRSKTVLTDDYDKVSIEVPRNRDGTFEPQPVKKRQRRLGEVDEIVLPLICQGITDREEFRAPRRRLQDESVSKDTISRITDRMIKKP